MYIKDGLHFRRNCGQKEFKIIVIGLDNSGKTSILSHTHLTQTNPVLGWRDEGKRSSRFVSLY